MRIGFGWDIHKLTEGRKFVLGGVQIESEKGSLGHSDGDVVLHALTDAILGVLSLGDIGEHFKDSDEKWKDADSSIFVCKALNLLKEKGYKILNVDITVILEKPKLSPYKEEIRKKIASLLEIEINDVSFKAKTKEGLDEVGKGNAVECFAVVLVNR